MRLFSRALIRRLTDFRRAGGGMVDTQRSERCGRKAVEVQVLSCAQHMSVTSYGIIS
jgi:hypothetical protein